MNIKERLKRLERRGQPPERVIFDVWILDEASGMATRFGEDETMTIAALNSRQSEEGLQALTIDWPMDTT